MMPLYIFLVFLSEICQVLAVDTTSGVNQDSGLMTAEVGGEVTLHCFFQNDAITFLSWYQQSLGDKPLIISSQMKHHAEASVFPAYKERFRVIARGEEGINHLRITDLRLSDSATYYCGILEFNTIEFGQGVFLHVKTSLSNIQAVIHQPPLEPLRLGDSVNLSCTVYAEPCIREQNFYWFRHGAAQPAVMYHSAGQCVNDSDVQKCTLNLTITSVSSSDAGMYYCALASCGEILFGNGTSVEIAGSPKVPRFLVYCLSVGLALSIITLLVLAFITYKLKKRTCPVCKGRVSHLTCSAVSDTVSQDEDILHYAALSVNRTSERHRPEESVESVCVYSRVKSRKE